MTPAAVVFDLDGTLIDSAPDLAAAIDVLRSELGLPPLGLVGVRERIGDGARRLVERSLEDAGDSRLAERALPRFLELYGARAVEFTRAYPGMTDLVARLAASRPVGVLTNKPEGPSRAILEHLNLMPHLREVIGGDTLPTRKPDPAGLLEMVRRLGVDPGESVLVGDSAIDAATATAAGARFVFAEWGYARDAERPDLLARHPTARDAAALARGLGL